MPFPWLSVYMVFVPILVQSGHGKLLLVQSLFRHGYRSPTHLYPNDPNPGYVWPEGLGKLTQLGKLQHYVLGKNIRSFYSDFITSNPNEVMVNSTFKDRCLRSAECHLAGLYRPTPEWQFTTDIDWQPIPVHYLNRNNDPFLNPKYDCPRAEEGEEAIFNSPAFQKYEEQNMPMLSNLSECVGLNLTRKKASRLATTIEIQLDYNLKVPPCIFPYYHQLQRFGDVCHFVEYQSPVVQRLRAGPLLGRIIENMNKKLSGDFPDLKFQVYSARDRNLIVVMSALGVFNFKKPPYACTLLFELHQLDEGPAVRLLLFNSTRPQDGDQRPYLLKLHECGEFCPLEQFQQVAQPLIPEDVDKECQLDS